MRWPRSRLKSARSRPVSSRSFGSRRGAQNAGMSEKPKPEVPKKIDKQASQNVASTRAKGSGHKKKTADKWNQ